MSPFENHNLPFSPEFTISSSRVKCPLIGGLRFSSQPFQPPGGSAVSKGLSFPTASVQVRFRRNLFSGPGPPLPPLLFTLSYSQVVPRKNDTCAFFPLPPMQTSKPFQTVTQHPLPDIRGVSLPPRFLGEGSFLFPFVTFLPIQRWLGFRAFSLLEKVLEAGVLSPSLFFGPFLSSIWGPSMAAVSCLVKENHVLKHIRRTLLVPVHVRSSLAFLLPLSVPRVATPFLSGGIRPTCRPYGGSSCLALPPSAVKQDITSFVRLLRFSISLGQKPTSSTGE